MLEDHSSPLPYEEAQMSYKYAEQASTETAPISTQR